MAVAMALVVLIYVAGNPREQAHNGFRLHMKARGSLDVAVDIPASKEHIGNAAAETRGVVPPAPSLESFKRLEADPSLVHKEPALLEEFMAAPWLLPPNVSALPYFGVHDFDKLLSLRAMTVAGQEKVVSFIFYNKLFADLMQNCLYTLVKFGGVKNHILLTWTPDDLAACQEMNLPCADVTFLMPEPPDNKPGAGEFGTHDYLSIVWLKPAVVLYALKQGYTTFVSDSDTAYSHWPVLESFLGLLRAEQVDGAFQVEGPVNTRVYLVAPSAGTLFAFEQWVNRTAQDMNASQHDQYGLGMLHRKGYETCTHPMGCLRIREQITHGNRTVALFRQLLPAWYMMVPDVCGMADFNHAPRTDPCDWNSLFVHTICIVGSSRKPIALRKGDWWYMDSDDEHACPRRNGSSVEVPLCRPRQWRLPQTEERVFNCKNRSRLGLINPGMRDRSPPPPSPAPSPPAAQTAAANGRQQGNPALA